MSIQSDHSFWGALGLLGARNLGATTLNVWLNRQVIPVALRNGFCLENLVSQSTKGFFNSCVGILITPRKIFSSVFGLSRERAERSIVPVMEELEFRYLLQQVMLKHLPQTVLDRVFPDHNIDLDAVPFKILRILVTASIFAACHINQYSCDQGGGLDPLIGGLLYSAIIEMGGSVLHTTILHMLWNQFSQPIDQVMENYLSL